MHISLSEFINEQKKQSNVLAILMVDNKKAPSVMTDGFDLVVVVVQENGCNWLVNHYEVGDEKVSIHYIKKDLVHETLINRKEPRFFDWLLRGEIVLDRLRFLHEMKEGITAFPLEKRQKEITIQFTKILRHFDEGKTLFNNGYFFDAFSKLMQAFHHLAKLSVIYYGSYPDATVWEQVRYIEPQKYKLYQELLTSNETLNERIELLTLTTEFEIHSMTDIGSRHFLSLIKDNIFTVSDIMQHEEIIDYRMDLELLINHLVKNGYLGYEREMTNGYVSTIFYRLNNF